MQGVFYQAFKGSELCYVLVIMLENKVTRDK
jgi:hypothetical protein